MYTENSIFFVLLCSIISHSSQNGMQQQDIIERLYYPLENGSNSTNQLQVEFLIVGRKVSWMEAKALCPFYGIQNQQRDEILQDNSDFLNDFNSQDSLYRNKEIYNSTLAVFANDDMEEWLSQRLSESNYRFDGLWIGAKRKNDSSDWLWIDSNNRENKELFKALNSDSFPFWYKPSKKTISERNCVLFDRIGHDVPILLPENCSYEKSFICMQYVRNKPKNNIIEENSVSIDGYRYTLFRVVENEDETSKKFGVKKLNGGGISWSDARLECQRRGQSLAMIFTNEAASAIANIMMRSRPTMENAWLGGWSLEGQEWIWVPSGFKLSATKSNSTRYPPWLEGHPIVVPTNDQRARKIGRCLILDRHLCPKQLAPVFLDLDCDKKRPFICQSGFTVETKELLVIDRKSIVNDEIYEFSDKEVTYEQGEEYCKQRNGRIASIPDSKTLSGCLDKMSELAIDHVWLDGRTVNKDNEWHWIDSNDQTLFQGIGSESSWCLGKESNSPPKSEPNACLNLDYETRGFPLFYGLPCNKSQIILCNIKPYLSESDDLTEALSDEVDTRLFSNKSDGAVVGGPQVTKAPETTQSSISTIESTTPPTTDSNNEGSQSE